MRLAAEVFPQAFLPENLAALSFKTNEVTVGSQRVDEISINGWSGASLWVRRILIWVADVADARGSENSSILS